MGNEISICTNTSIRLADKKHGSIDTSLMESSRSDQQRSKNPFLCGICRNNDRVINRDYAPELENILTDNHQGNKSKDYRLNKDDNLDWLHDQTDMEQINIKSDKFKGFRKHFRKQFQNKEEYYKRIKTLQNRPEMIPHFLIQYQKWVLKDK